MASVVIRDVEKAFGSTKVIHGINIDIEDGEFVVLVGPSGCGKSTLLRMVAGLEEITGGTISIGAREVNHLPPKERDVAMVFQNYALYPHMTVYDNMAFSLKLRKADSKLIDERVQKAASILNLTEYLKRYPRQLSGGQRQRVAMGTEIKALHQRLKTTTIYVTHDQVEAMTMADRIVVMHDGIVEQVGTPLELYDHPANTFVAGFIGSPAMNFVEGTLRNGAGAARVETGGGQIVRVLSAGRGREGQKVIVGVRPEHLSLGAANEGFSGKVTVVEPTGAETQIFVDTPAGPVTAVFTERHDFAPGTPIVLKPRPEAIHLFDAQSGQHL
jgi:multiple sugar transport system ATP-binding protein